MTVDKIPLSQLGKVTLEGHSDFLRAPEEAGSRTSMGTDVIVKPTGSVIGFYWPSS